MEFDPRKRYCQNRAPKRTREKCVPVDPAEEERQFKLRRFVNDISKFVEDKENVGCKTVSNIGKEKQKTLKEKKTTKLVARNARVGLSQNKVQTQICTRAKVQTREMTARLDKSLAEIIGLANNTTRNNCSRQIPHAIGCANPSETQRKPTKTSHFDSQTSSIDDDLNCSSTPPLRSSIPNQERSLSVFPKKESLEELEKQLYLEFTKLVTISSVESKSAQFKNQSYAAKVKKKLQGIYMQENTQESSCASEPQKSSVATSPLALSPAGGSNVSSGQNQFTFTQINFVPNPTKSAKEFLEETIGPGSSSHNPRSSPELSGYRPSPAYSQVYRPSPELPSCSPPFASKSDRYCHPELSPNLMYVNSPFPSQQFSPYDYGSMRVLSKMDRRPFNQINWFLPPVEDDSPEMRYFPRMMF